MTWQTEFPDFPAADMPAIPEGFEDTSWHNNSAPSFDNQKLGLSIYIDYADSSQREWPELERFSVTEIETDGAPKTDFPALLTDDWSEVLKFIASREG